MKAFIKISTIILISSFIVSVPQEVQAAKKNSPSMAAKTKKVQVGKAAKIKIKKNKIKKIIKTTWTTNNKNIVELRAKKKTSVMIIVKDTQTVKIKAKVKYRRKGSKKIYTQKLTCKITGTANNTSQPTQDSSTDSAKDDTDKKIIKNGQDVAALNAIIKEQKALSAEVSEDLDNFQYEWNEEGRLVSINWEYAKLKGNIRFSGLSTLQKLYCSYNSLEGLDVSACTSLQILKCCNNNLKEITISSCSSLTELYCYMNELTKLDLSSCSQLTQLYCYKNKLTELDVKSNTLLTILYCYSNNLTSLNASSCTKLADLKCNSNSLTALDISSCVSLEFLNCSNNSLTSLDISSCPVLQQNSDFLSYDSGVEIIGQKQTV